MKRISDMDTLVLANFRRGCVIPAQPLALDSNRKFCAALSACVDPLLHRCRGWRYSSWCALDAV